MATHDDTHNQARQDDMTSGGPDALSAGQGTSLAAPGLLFDCDGVLVNSDASVISAWSRWAEQFDLVPADVVAVVHGRRAADTVAVLIDAERREHALRLINQFEIEDARAVPAVPGAAELLSTLPAHAWAIVTSALQPLATARIRAARIPQPDVLVTADLVSRGKPDPEGYLLAASRLGLAAEQCVVIEDAVDGVQAARAAHVGAVVGVGNRVAQAPIDAHVDDLRQLTWTQGTLTIAPPDR